MDLQGSATEKWHYKRSGTQYQCEHRCFGAAFTQITPMSVSPALRQVVVPSYSIHSLYHGLYFFHFFFL